VFDPTEVLDALQHGNGIINLVAEVAAVNPTGSLTLLQPEIAAGQQRGSSE
jgi:hypothetical protein